MSDKEPELRSNQMKTFSPQSFLASLYTPGVVVCAILCILRRSLCENKPFLNTLR
ncbi:hypothetical protein BGX38DRAFT_337340 [Terfezia claveryi]|nr:hypothetical protein BGX38DRAFT_337340 [Terfezia claveryi]